MLLMSKVALSALRESGTLGTRAAELIESQRRHITTLRQELEASQRAVRDQALVIERQRREIAEYRSRAMFDD